MDTNFWLKKWQDNQLGFHQQKVNSRLQRFWESMVTGHESVFVPLCGKSKDMAWLAQQGHAVLGIELSAIACRDFFVENDRSFEVIEKEANGGPFTRFKDDQIELLQGDFFALTPEDLKDVRYIYDRASLVALPGQMRAQFSEHLARITKPQDRMLLITMEYDPSKMKGPPFSVSEEEVYRLFNGPFDIEIVSESSGPEIVGNLAERGLDTLTEKVYVLTRSE